MSSCPASGIASKSVSEAIMEANTTMRAAVFGGGQDIRVEEIPAPRPKTGQVLVEIRAAGICGSDLHRYRGIDPWGGGGPGPRLAGHELAGVITELGDGVTGLALGQGVAVIPMQLKACERCPPCRRGATNLCLERGRVGGKRLASVGFAELDVASAEHAVPVPVGLPLEIAALADVYACALHALHRVRVTAIDTVLIVGSGSVALALGQILRASGAARVLLAGRRDAALELAKRCGAADEVINSRRVELASTVAEHTAGSGADAVFEVVGGTTSETLRQGVEALAGGGTLAILGAFEGDVRIPYREANRKEITIRWSNGYSRWQGRSEFALVLDWLATGRLDGTSLITHRFPLKEIGQAFRAADDKAASGAVKVIVEPAARSAPDPASATR